MLKKITAMLMAVALVVGMVAFPAKAENTQYVDMTIDSFYGGGGNAWYLPQIHTNGNWRFYLKPSMDLNAVQGTYWLRMSNGVTQETIPFYVESGSTDQIYTVGIAKDFIDDTKESTITIEKGTYQAEGKDYGINLKQDFVFYVNNGSWSTDSFKVRPASGKNATLMLNMTPNAEITTGGNQNGFYVYADFEDGAQTTNESWSKEYDLVPLTSAADGSEFHTANGIYENGTKTDYRLIKYGEKIYYVEVSGGATVAAEYTLKGLFRDKNGRIVGFSPITVTWDGTKWNVKKDDTDITVTQYTGKLTLEGAGWYATDANIKSNCIYLHGTDSYLSEEGEEWNEPKRKLVAADEESGVYVGGKKQESVDFKKFLGGIMNTANATHMYYIGGISAKTGEVLTVKGNFLTQDGASKIYLAESRFVWNGTTWTEYEEPILPDETNRKLTIDKDTVNGGTEKGIYLLTDDGFAVDKSWSTNISALSGAENGIYLNDKRIEAPLKKYDDKKAYLALGDIGIEAKDKDKVTIKGTFKLDRYRVSYKEVNFYFNGQVWSEVYKAPEKVTYTDIMLDSLLDVTRYRDAEERWDVYISTKGSLPGVGDQINFPEVKVVVDGEEQNIVAYHAAHEDSFFFILDKSVLPKAPSKNTKIVIKAGTYKSSDVTKGIRIKKDYTIYANKYGLSSKDYLGKAVPSKKNIKLAIDREVLYGGDGNGIFVTTEDGFPTDASWQTSIRAVAYDKDSGVFVNGQKIEAVLKRYQDGKLYIGLADGGVVAKDKDKVVIKGLFMLGDQVMSYAPHTFYYNGKTWNTTYFKQTTKRVKVSGVSINPVSSYDAERKWWNVYINVKGKLPGEIDRTSFDGLRVVVNGKTIESKISYHSYEDTLYFPIPEEYLKGDAKNGVEIVVKAGKATASDRLSEIIWTKDFKFYTFAGSLTEVRPTSNTKWLSSNIGLFKTSPYHEEWNAWQVLIAVEETFTTENGIFFYQLPIEINGKQYLVRATQSGTNLAFDVTKDMIDPASTGGILKIRAGASAIANAGKDGVRITNDLTLYLFNGSWSDKKYTKVTNTDCKMVGVQDSTFVKNPDGTGYTNMYVWMDTKMPGDAWFEAYLVPVLYNGKKQTVQMERVVSAFGRLMYFGFSGIPKDGDIVKFSAGTKAVAGGIAFTIRDDFSLYYENGQWSEYVKTDVKKPKAEKSLWEVARFDSAFIPYTKNGVVTFSNTDQYSVISSNEPMKDYTIRFKARKLEDNNETLPNFSVMLRANAIDENTPVSTDAMYGYIVNFQYNQLSLFKNHVNWELTDAYRLAYEPLEENEKFFEFGVDYEYEISIYNVTDTCVCITVSVNDVEQIRYYDHASGDAKDPVVNAGDFRIYAECTTSITDSVAKTDELIVSTDTTEINKGVYVSASYPYVAEDTEFTVSGTGAIVEEGVFKATQPGTYTVSATYKGKAVEPKTIVVTEPEKKESEAQEEIIYEEVINWPAVIAMAVGGVVVLLGLVIFVIGMKKRKSGKSEVE